MTNIKKYKVEFVMQTVYVFDVLAEDEAKAEDLASDKFTRSESDGTLHYHETDRDIKTGVIYDVSNTDDSFDAE